MTDTQTLTKGDLAPFTEANYSSPTDSAETISLPRAPGFSPSAPEPIGCLIK